MSWIAKCIAKPEQGLLMLCMAQLVFWTLAPLLTHTSPPLDVVEIYAWGREGVVATYKHPNLPGLVLEATRRATFGAIWPTYLVSQAFIVAAFAAVFLLGRDIMNAKSALAGVLLLTGIFYYSWPTPEMNHNIAQIPLWAITILALWRAVERDQRFWWVVLGLAAGLSIWAKYSTAILLVVALFWLLGDKRARRTLGTSGPWIGLIVFLAVVSPQVRYLIETDFLPLSYAQARATGGGSDPWWSFIIAQIANHGVMFAMLVVSGIVGYRAVRADGQNPPQTAGALPDHRARLFLTVMVLGPLLLLVTGALVTGAGLKDMWGAPMFNLSGLLAIAWLAPRISDRIVERIAVFSAVLLIAVPLGYAGHVALRPLMKDKPHRANWPQAEIAATLSEAFQNETGQPVKIVAGTVWEAGVVALTLPSNPSVAIDGSIVKAPWVTEEDYDKYGFLAVWPADQHPGPELARRLTGQTVSTKTFRWSGRPNARKIVLSYVVVPPVQR